MSSFSDLVKKANATTNTSKKTSAKEEERKTTSSFGDLVKKAYDGSHTRTTLTGDEVSSWVNGVAGLSERAYNYLKSDGYKTPDANLRKEIDDYLSKANDVAQYVRANKTNYKNYDEVYNGLYEQINGLRRMQTSLNESDAYYGAFGSEDVYFWSAAENREKRQQRYTDNQQKIERLKAERNQSTTTRQRKSEIDAELATIETEMRNYERGNDYFANKTVDDYYLNYTGKTDFGGVSANRSFTNPTTDALQRDDIMNDSSQWYWGADGKQYDAFGNEVVKGYDSKGNAIWVSSGLSGSKITDRLGFYLNASETELDDAAATDVNHEGTATSVLKDGIHGNWELLNDTEVSIYYYILNSEGQAAADKYLDSMTTELNKRATKNSVAHLASTYENANWAERAVLNVATVGAQLFSNIAGGIDYAGSVITGKELNPYSMAYAGKHFSDTVRGEAAKNWDEATGGAEIPIIGFSAGDLYQTGMSLLDSYAAMGIGGHLGGVLLGMGAGASEAVRLYEEGASDAQIAWGGMLAGAAEMVLETVSIGELKAIKNADDVNRIIKHALIQGGVEASEEGFTEIANTITNAIVMGSESEWAKLIEENDGNVLQAVLKKLQEVGAAAFGGFLSGFAGGSGVASVYGTASNLAEAEAAKNLYGENPTALIDEALEINPKNKFAQKMQTRAADGKDISGSQLAKLVRQNEAGMVKNDTAAIKEAAKQRLADLGETMDIEAVSSALAKQATGEKLTKAEQQTISNSKYGQRVANELNTENIKSGEFSSEWAQKIDTDRINADEYSSLVKAAQIEQTADSVAEDNSITNSTIEPQDTKMEATEATIKDSLQVEDEAAQPDNANTQAPVNVLADNVVDIDEDQPEKSSITLENASKAYGAQAGAYVSTYNLSPGQDIAKFDDAYRKIYDWGKTGAVPLEYAKKKSSLTNALTEAQREAAYRAGADAKASLAQERERKMKTGAAVRGEAKPKIKNGRKVGVVKLGNITMSELKAIEKEDGSQGKQINMLRFLAEATGRDIILVKSKVGKDGKYRLSDKEDYQGKFSWRDGNIYIDVNAGLLEEGDTTYTLINTFTHEFVHTIERDNAAGYNELRDVVFAELRARGYGKIVDDLIDEQGADENGNPILEYDAASREVVAESLAYILRDSHFIENLANNHKSLFEQLLDRLKDFVKKLRGYFKDLSENPKIYAGAKVLQDNIDGALRYAENIIEVFDRVALQSVENYQAAVTGASVDGGVRIDGVSTEMAASGIDIDGDAGRHQHSIRSVSEGAGLVFTANEDGTFEITNTNGDKVTHVTAKHMENSPLGNLVKIAAERGFIPKSDVKVQCGFLADVVNMCLEYRDSALVWEVAGTTVFSALKSNSDTQYGTTIDFSTVCKKTQAIIDAMSETMLRLGRGLTRSEVEQVYLQVGLAGEETPCPVCYVFSRWMGVGGILDQMNRFQDAYADKSTADLISFMEEIEQRIIDRAYTKNKNGKVKADFFTKAGDVKNGTVLSDLKAKASSRATSALKKLAKNSDIKLQIQELETLMESQTEADAKKTATKIKKLGKKLVDVSEVERIMKEANDEVEEYEAYQWLAATMLEEIIETDERGKNPKHVGWKRNTAFKPVPAEVLFDLNKGDEFASNYPSSWKFRTTKGCAAGKAILPYSDARVGETIQGIARGVKEIQTDRDLNAFLNGDIETQKKLVDSAIAKMARQNLLGGQRYQSTSDFRYEYGSDYLITFLEMQAVGAKVQLYTKVIEAVDFLASVGCDCNLSVMPLGDGYITLPDGTKKLVCSSVTGINAEAAIKKAQQYNNVQLILVGISDEHVRLALEGTDVTFVIPFHGSGNTVHQIQSLMNMLGESLDVTKAQDYTAVQSDHHMKHKTAEQKALWDLRCKIISRAYKVGDKTVKWDGNLSAAEYELLESKNGSFVKDLYRRFYVDKSAEEYGVALQKDQSEQIFPYEYWDKSLTYDEADQNGERFKQYCASMGIIPRFSGKDSDGKDVGFGDFTKNKGYWKLLIDRPMYNNKYDADGNWIGYGEYHEQARINVTNFKTETIDPAWGTAHYGEVMSKKNDPSKTSKIADAVVAQIEGKSDLDNGDADIIQLQARNFNKDGVQYQSRKWMPRLTSPQWDLLNRAKMQEATTSDKYLNKYAKWLYRETGTGTKVFAIYNPTNTEDPTVLYASGGQLAEAEYEAFNEFKEDYLNGTFTGNETSHQMAQSFKMRHANDDWYSRPYGYSGKTGQDDGVYGRTRKRNTSRAFWICLANLTSGERGNGGDDLNQYQPRSNLRQPAPVFYSKMAKVVEGMKQEKFGASSVISMLTDPKRGVKAEEIKWSGIEEFLEGKKSVTKAELLEFIAGSMLQIEEFVRDDRDIAPTAEEEALMAKHEEEMLRKHNSLKKAWRDLFGDEFRYEATTLYLTAETRSLIQGRKRKAFEDKSKELMGELSAIVDKRNNLGMGSKSKAVDWLNTTRLMIASEQRDESGLDAVDSLAEYMGSFKGLNESECRVFSEWIKTDILSRTAAQEITPQEQRIIDMAAEVEEERKEIGDIQAGYVSRAEQYETKWEQYTLKGGENYREIVFKLPNALYSNTAMKSHWGKDAEGILAHARVQDFDVNGGKMLFIEEIQSDWHNEGEKHGYASADDANLIEEYTKVRKERMPYHDKIRPVVERACNEIGFDDDSVYSALLHEDWNKIEYFDRLAEFFSEEDMKNLKADAELFKKHQALKKEITARGLKISAVPDAPFKKTYHEFVLKRLIREAAENGYDSIGWTTAYTQTKRWSDEYAEGYHIEYDQDIPKFLRKYGKKWGATVGKTELDAGESVGYSTDDGKVFTSVLDAIRYLQESAEETLGYKPKHYKTEWKDGATEVRDKNGVILGTIKRVRKTSVWSMPITEAMKESVIYEGQEQYQSRDYLQKRDNDGTRNATAKDSDGNELSREQRRFFKSSKVVDANGNLLVVFHCSPHEFTEFDTTKGRFGIYLTSNQQLASSYGAKTIKGYVNITNPKTIDAEYARANTLDVSKMAREAQEEGYDGLIITNLIHAGSTNYDEALLLLNPDAVMARDSARETIDSLNDATGLLDKIYDISDEFINLNIYTDRNLIDNLISDHVIELTKRQVQELESLKPIFGDFVPYIDKYNNAIKAIQESENNNANEIADTVYVAFDSSQIKSVDNRTPTNDPDINYQERTRSISDRQLLQMAAGEIDIEGLTEGEKEALRIFNERLAKLSKLQEERSAQWKSFFQQKNKDKAEATKTRNRIKVLDGQIKKANDAVLDVEEKSVLRSVLKKAREIIEAQDKEAFDAKIKRIRERRNNSTQIRDYRERIRRTIRALDKVLNKGNKKQNVKEGMQEFVSKALKSADVLFTDEYNDEDMIRNGVGTQMTEKEAKQMEVAKQVLAEIDGLRSQLANMTDAAAMLPIQNKLEELKPKLDYRRSQLRDVFARERTRINSAPADQLLADLAREYKKLQESEHGYIASAYQDSVYEFLNNLQQNLESKVVSDMTAAELAELYSAYTMVLTTVRDANKAFAADIKETIEQLGNRTMFEVHKEGKDVKKRTKASQAVSSFSWNNTKPIYAFERIGSSTLTRLYNNIANGENVYAMDVAAAKDFVLKTKKKHGYTAWDLEKTYEFTSSSGMTFSLNLPQIMSVYAYSKRDAAHDHLTKGGFVFSDKTEVIVNKLGIPVTYLNEDATAYNVSDELVAEIVSDKYMTKEQRDFVDEMQDYLSNVVGENGNEVSMKLFGVKLFGEEHYFPLRSSGAYLTKAKEAELKKEQGQISLVNSGFTKATTPKASNPIVLEGFMDVWSDHVNDMSLYHAFVLPLEDFRRVYNYNSPHVEEGKSMSVDSAIRNAQGRAASQYIDQLLRDINGGTVSDPRETPFKTWISKFKKASVVASMSVVVQQPTAMFRAMAYIDRKYFGVSPMVTGVGRALGNVFTKAHTKAWEEVKTYAPGVAIIKEIGGFDTSTGQSITDYLSTNEYEKGKLKALFRDKQYGRAKIDEALGKLPAMADELAWVEIWNAVKRETKDRNKGMDVTSEEFLKIAGERFTEVIRKTQVYDSVFTKSANMRSKSGFMAMMTSFMAEPTTTANMMEDAMRNLVKGNWKFAARVTASVATSIIINNILRSIVYAMRDDDDDETFAEKYAEALTSGLIDDVVVFNYYPFLRDIWSLAQGYDVERADMTVISTVLEALNNAKDAWFKDTSEMDEVELAEHEKACWEAGWSFVDAAASMFGLPVKNIRRDIMGVFNTYDTISKDAAGRDTTLLSWWDKVKEAALKSLPELIRPEMPSKREKLYQAILTGDDAYVERTSSGYTSEDAYHSALRQALRENDPRIKEAALARFGGDFNTYSRIAKQIIAERNFTQNDIVAAISSELNKLKPDDGGDSPQKLTGLYKAEDFAMAVSTGDWTNAAAIKTDIVNTHMANGKDKDEAEKSFRSSAKSVCKDMFILGDITESEAIKAMTSYMGLTDKEAKADVQYWNFTSKYPDIYADDSWFDAYYEKVESSGLDIGVYMNYRNQVKDVDGKDKKVRRMAVINSLPITSAQKDALYYAEGWTQSKINEAPWR